MKMFCPELLVYGLSATTFGDFDRASLFACPASPSGTGEKKIPLCALCASVVSRLMDLGSFSLSTRGEVFDGIDPD
jgi:hypothetical protein